MTEAGYGTSNAPFKGTPWKLPNGVVLMDSIHDFTFCISMSTPPRYEPYKNFHGIPGGVFQTCMTLRNTTGTSVIVDFPETLLITSSHVQSQNGLLLFLGSVVIPAHADVTVMSGGFCVNLSRHLPTVFDEAGNILSYSFGPSETPNGLNEIRDILKPKHLSYQNVLKADGSIDIDKATKFSVIQGAIWEVTDGGGLTEATRKKLKDL